MGMRNRTTTDLFNDLCVKFRDDNDWTDNDIMSCFMNGIVSLARSYNVKPVKVEEMLSDLRYYINCEDDFEKPVDQEDFD